ncbi:unnamed protein product [Cylicostephanus goldi]|uniref:Uncharacterized protein n=1 Tax=Cylicostephanus goldi TaxID=71465 RepID=A0A3P7MRI8_CYLGO|nr:unnamed protein product [Cylicostephanus goldi]
MMDPELRAHLFDTTVLPVLCYTAKTWADTVATSKALRNDQKAFERSFLKMSGHKQHLVGFRSTDLRKMSRLCDSAEYVAKAKHLWAVTSEKQQTTEGHKKRWSGDARHLMPVS